MRPIHTDLPAPTSGMLLAKRPTGVTMAFVALLIAIALQSIPTIVQTYAARAAGEQTASFGFGRFEGALSLFTFGIALLWLWLWVAAKERRRFSTLGFERRGKGVRQAARGFGIGVAMIAVCVLVPVATGQARLEWALPDLAGWWFVALMLFGFLLQGSTEEILTRGYLTQAVARRWGLLVAVIVQAVFFTLLHGMNPGMGVVPIVNLLAFALFASLFSLAEGSLWGICAMHGAWNWAQGNLFGVAVSGTEVQDSVLGYAAEPGSNDLLTGGAFGVEGSLVTTLVYGVGIAIAWRAFRKRRTAEGAVSRAL